jgi:hypothetical protein
MALIKFFRIVIKNELFLIFIFISPAIFWLILTIVNLVERDIYTKVRLVPLPFVFHGISVVAMCFIYLYVFLLTKLKNIFLRLIVAISFVVFFMSTYEFFYWIFLISNLNFDLSRIDYLDLFEPRLIIKKPTLNQLPLKFLKISIFIIVFLSVFLWLINRKNNLFNFKKINVYFSLVIFTIFLTVMIILREQGFFLKTLLWFSGITHTNPHNLLWVLSKLLAMLMFFPIIKTKFN